MKFRVQDYGKPSFRREMSQMSYPMKVDCVIDMQERVMPIRMRRGEIVQPWRRDGQDSVTDAQSRFCSHLRDMVPRDLLETCEKVMIAHRQSCEPHTYDIKIGESTNAY